MKRRTLKRFPKGSAERQLIVRALRKARIRPEEADEMLPRELGTRICNAGFSLKGGALMEYVYGHGQAATESATRPATVTPMLSPEPVAQAARRADRRAVMQEALDAMKSKTEDTAEEGIPLGKRILIGVLFGTAVLGVIVWALN